MEIYVVLKDKENDGTYEDYEFHYRMFEGIFTSKENAIEFIKKKYFNSNPISELKEIKKEECYGWFFGNGYASEWDVSYTIFNITELDKSFDELEELKFKDGGKHYDMGSN